MPEVVSQYPEVVSQPGHADRMGSLAQASFPERCGAVTARYQAASGCRVAQ